MSWRLRLIMHLFSCIMSPGPLIQFLSENGELALNMALVFCPDMIILDIMMPVMDGFK